MFTLQLEVNVLLVWIQSMLQNVTKLVSHSIWAGTNMHIIKPYLLTVYNIMTFQDMYYFIFLLSVYMSEYNFSLS
jgi:hypothetical protein